MTVSKAGRPRLGPWWLVALLAFISLANVSLLFVAVMAWYSERAHGGDLQGYATIAVLLSAIALVGISGAWALREWGATLYLGAEATRCLLTLFTAPDAFGPLSYVPLLMAGVLWLLTR